jgi:putative ABC transport system permease protein
MNVLVPLGGLQKNFTLTAMFDDVVDYACADKRSLYVSSEFTLPEPIPSGFTSSEPMPPESMSSESMPPESTLSAPVPSESMSSQITSTPTQSIQFTFEKSKRREDLGLFFDFLGLSGLLENDWRQLSRLKKDLNIGASQNIFRIAPAGRAPGGASGVYLLFILPVLACGYLFIYFTTSLSVHKDARQLGVLKSIGMIESQVKGYVLFQPLFLLLPGVLSAYLISIPVCRLFIPEILQFLNIHSGQVIIGWSFSVYIISTALILSAILIAVETVMRRLRNVSGTPRMLKSRARSGGLRPNTIRSLARLNVRRHVHTVIPSIIILFIGASFLLVADSLLLSMDENNYADLYVGENDIVLLDTIDGADAPQPPGGQSQMSGSSPQMSRIQSQAPSVLSEELISSLKEVPQISRISAVSSMDIEVNYSDVLETHIQGYENGGAAVRRDEPLPGLLIGLDPYLYESQLDEEYYNDFENGMIYLIGSDEPQIFPEKFTLEWHATQGEGFVFPIEGFVPALYETNTIAVCPTIYTSRTQIEKLGASSIGAPSIQKINIIFADTAASTDSASNSSASSTAPAAPSHSAGAIRSAASIDSDLLYQKIRDLIGGYAPVEIVYRGALQDEILSAKGVLRAALMSFSLMLILLGFAGFMMTTAINIDSRKFEMAALESIGMTKSQIRAMLLSEGFHYSCIITLSIAVPCNIIIFIIYNLFKSEATYAAFSYPAYTLISTIVLSAIILVLTPHVIYRATRDSKSISSRIRGSYNAYLS